DLEGNLQNLTLDTPPPPAGPPGPSAPPIEDELELEQRLHPSMERYRKHISPAWKDVTEESELSTDRDLHDYICCVAMWIAMRKLNGDDVTLLWSTGLLDPLNDST
ncbi:hypothetical protein E4U17_001613, partial [Claviceps sp. LM77 group G4]